jgi:hypothetical protein
MGQRVESKPVRLACAMLPPPLQSFPVHCPHFIAVPHPRRRRPPLWAMTLTPSHAPSDVAPVDETFAYPTSGVCEVHETSNPEPRASDTNFTPDTLIIPSGLGFTVQRVGCLRWIKYGSVFEN